MRGAWILAIASAALPAAAQEPRGSGPGLDRLLRLPESMEFASDEKGGATRAEWRQRFSEARTSLAAAERSLEDSQSQLASVAGSKSEWQFTPPGVPARESSEDSSSSYPLREQVRRARGEVDRAKARLRELDVQANLAGVPPEWRGASTNAASSDASGDGSETGSTSRP
jgi:hypothetical protein